MMPHLERIQTNSDWILPLLILAVLVWCVLKIYRRDGVELPAFWRFFLPILRIGVLLVLLWAYLQPQWVSEKERKIHSRFIVFCDTSLSMTLPESSEPNAPSRTEVLSQLWESTPLLARLNEKHDLVFAALDSEARVVWSAEKAISASLKENSSDSPSTPSSSKTPKDQSSESTSAAKPNWSALLRPQGTQSRQCDGIREWLSAHSDVPISGILLCSDGVQTSGGEMAPLTEMAQRRGIPIFTLGFGPTQPVENYRLTEMEAPARVLPQDPFLIRGAVEGFGFQTPAIPENASSAAQTPQTREIQVDLFCRKIPSQTEKNQTEKPHPDSQSDSDTKINSNSIPESTPASLAETQAEAETLVATQNLTLSEEGKQTAFEFRVEPQPVGKFLYSLRVRPGEHELNGADNEREAEVDVMDRKTRVLIFAGGPMREYQFLTTALFRDKKMETDVLLQSALPPSGTVPKNADEEKALKSRIQQDATRILLRFPETREELFAYDCILAIDANWKVLTPAQADWVEEWTARQGGGVIFIAGPVFMGMVGGWMDDSSLEKIRTLCPVEFFDRTSSMRQNTFTADEIWPLDWTRAGREATYLQLDDQPSTSERLWSEFPGVYGHFPTKRLRHGATSLASFSNPQTRIGDAAPVLLATQFYGSGRTFFLGTGEFWRLRSQNPELFVRFYAQIIHYVTQGRTLQQSRRGRLMLEQNRYFPGDPIEIRAQLQNPALQPLDPVAFPEVTAEVFLPNGKIQSVRLAADRAMPGLFTGRFSLLTEGRFRVELPIPDSAERLVQRAEIVLSDQERDQPQRNQTFLDALARQTGGVSFTNPTQPEFLAFPERLKDRTRTLVEFDSASPVIPPEILLYVLVSLLSLEWFLRRILKLA